MVAVVATTTPKRKKKKETIVNVHDWDQLIDERFVYKRNRN